VYNHRERENRERGSPYGAFSIALVVVGPTDLAIAALLLRNRVRLTPWSAEQDTRRCLGLGAARPAPTLRPKRRRIGRDGKGRSTAPCVSTGGGKAHPFPCSPVPLSIPHDAGRGGSVL